MTKNETCVVMELGLVVSKKIDRIYDAKVSTLID